MRENKYLLDESPLLIFPTLAKLIGLNKAIILQQIHYWLLKNETNENAVKDGRVWCYQSYPKWQEQFPFWDIQTIRRIILSLEEDGFVISSNFNRLKMDKTKWYTINYKQYQNDITILSKRYHESINLIVPIQDINKDTKDVIDKSITYSDSKESHKSSLKKQMGLEDNLKKQNTSPKKRNKLSQKEIDKFLNNEFFMEAIHLWNSFAPATPAHKKPTLLWKKVYLGLNQLRGGTFYSHKNWSGSYFDSFLKINKLTSAQVKKTIDRPFKKREIIETIKLLPSYCTEGRFIERQEYHKDLANMIYNPKSPFVSFFVLALIKGEAKPVGETIGVICKYPKIAERLKNTDTFDFEEADTTEKRKFNQIFAEIDGRLKAIPKTSYMRPNLESFFVDYRDALKGQGIRIRLWSYSPASWEWKKIIVLNTQPFNQIIEWMRGKGEKEKKEKENNESKYTFVQTSFREDEIENIDSL